MVSDLDSSKKAKLEAGRQKNKQESLSRCTPNGQELAEQVLWVITVQVEPKAGRLVERLYKKESGPGQVAQLVRVWS